MCRERGRGFCLFSRLAEVISCRVSGGVAVSLSPRVPVVRSVRPRAQTLSAAMQYTNTLLMFPRHFEEAEWVLRVTLSARVSKLGAEHPDTVATRRILASLLWRSGQFDEVRGEAID